MAKTEIVKLVFRRKTYVLTIANLIKLAFALAITRKENKNER